MLGIEREPDLTLHLLERAECLGRGRAIHVADLDWERGAVLAVMAELLQGGFALGSVLRGADGAEVADAVIFGVTSAGRDLRRRLSETPSTRAGIGYRPPDA